MTTMIPEVKAYLVEQFAWSCSQCGGRNPCSRSDVGTIVECKHCRLQVRIKFLVYENGAIVVKSD